VDLSTAQIDSITFNNDTLSVYEGGTQYLQDMLLDAGTIFPILIGTDSFYIDFENHRRGRYQIDLTGADELTSIGVANPSLYGEYKFHLRNGGINVDFPINFLDRIGIPLDIGDGYDSTNDPILEGYYDGSNYYFDELVDADTFITVWQTDSSGITSSNQIMIPLIASGEYNYIIDWGDGTTEVVTEFDSSAMTHTYSSAGTYTVQMRGKIKGWDFNSGGDKDKIIDIQKWGGAEVVQTGSYNLCTNLDISATDAPTITGVTALNSAFAYTNIDSLDASNWDVSSLTSIFRPFDQCTNLVYLNVNNWDVSNVTSIGYFAPGTALVTIEAENWVLSSIESLSRAFQLGNLENFDISSWDVTSGTLTSIRNTFNGCSSLKDLDVSGWNTSNVDDAISAFQFCRSLDSLKVDDWDVSSLSRADRMFQDLDAIDSLDLSKWNTASLTNMRFMFSGCDSIQVIKVDTMNVSNVTTMESAFSSCSRLERLNVSAWNTDTLESMASTFQLCQALDTIGVGAWDVADVTNMSGAFDRMTELDSIDVADWDVSNVTNMGFVFRSCSQLQKVNVSGWTTTAVNDVNQMFENCINIDTVGVYNWDVTGVTKAFNIFSGVTLTTSNYDQILINWEAQAVQNNVGFDGGNSIYTTGSAAATARAALISDHSWTITDGGGT